MTLGEVKRSNIIKFQLQSQFLRFLYQTLYVYKRCETYRTEFSFCRLGHAPGVGLKDKKLERGDLRWRPIDCAFWFFYCPKVQLVERPLSEQKVVGSNPSFSIPKTYAAISNGTLPASGNGYSCLGPVFRPLTDSNQHGFPTFLCHIGVPTFS